MPSGAETNGRPHARSLDILYVGTLPPHPGGSATVGGLVVRGLHQRGHRVRALRALPAGVQDTFAAANPGLHVTPFTTDRFRVAADQIPESERRAEDDALRVRLAELVAARRPDAIMVGREALAAGVLTDGVNQGIPTALIVHSESAAGLFTGFLKGADRDRMRSAFLAADAIVAVAKQVVPLYRDLGCRNVVLVENGIDTRAFHPGSRPVELARSHGIAANEVVVMHLSNFKDVKRPLDIAESAALALREDPSLRYVMVGNGEFREPLERRARQLGVAERFVFTGWVPYERVPEYVRLADVVLMPSRTEALAMVYLETLASGRVLVASDIAAVRNVVRDGEDALLHPCGDVTAMAAATLMAAGDAALRARLGAAARRTAERHGLDPMLDGYEAALRGMAA